MKIFNYKIRRDTNASNMAGGLGSYTYTSSKIVPFYQFEKIHNDNDFVDKGGGTLKKYLEMIRTQSKISPGNKYFLFIIGCADVSTPNYDLLYELSHRRSMKVQIPDGITFDNDAFIRHFILNKNNLSDYNCGLVRAEELQIQLGGSQKTSFQYSRMSTRFRKHRSSSTKRHGRKALKTRKMRGGLFTTLKNTVRKITNKAGITESSVDKMFREEEEKIQAMKQTKGSPMNFGYQVNRSTGTIKKV
jgi:hypothetical protein